MKYPTGTASLARKVTLMAEPVTGYVWCDQHGTVHEQTGNPYDALVSECDSRVWRMLWAEDSKATDGEV